MQPETVATATTRSPHQACTDLLDDNQAMLCPYHNRTNDDDAHINKRGRVRFIGGMPVWVSPRGYAVPNPYHQFGAMRLLFH